MDPACVVGHIKPIVCALWTIEERGLLKEILEAAYERISDAVEYLLSNAIGPLYYFNGPE